MATMTSGGAAKDPTMWASKIETTMDASFHAAVRKIQEAPGMSSFPSMMTGKWDETPIGKVIEDIYNLKKQLEDQITNVIIPAMLPDSLRPAVLAAKISMVIKKINALLQAIAKLIKMVQQIQQRMQKFFQDQINALAKLAQSLCMLKLPDLPSLPDLTLNLGLDFELATIDMGALKSIQGANFTAPKLDTSSLTGAANACKANLQNLKNDAKNKLKQLQKVKAEVVNPLNQVPGAGEMRAIAKVTEQYKTTQTQMEAANNQMNALQDQLKDMIPTSVILPNFHATAMMRSSREFVFDPTRVVKDSVTGKWSPVTTPEDGTFGIMYPTKLIPDMTDEELAGMKDEQRFAYGWKIDSETGQPWFHVMHQYNYTPMVQVVADFVLSGGDGLQTKIAGYTIPIVKLAESQDTNWVGPNDFLSSKKGSTYKTDLGGGVNKPFEYVFESPGVYLLTLKVKAPSTSGSEYHTYKKKIVVELPSGSMAPPAGGQGFGELTFSDPQGGVVILDNSDPEQNIVRVSPNTKVSFKSDSTLNDPQTNLGAEIDSYEWSFEDFKPYDSLNFVVQHLPSKMDPYKSIEFRVKGNLPARVLVL